MLLSSIHKLEIIKAGIVLMIEFKKARLDMNCGIYELSKTLQYFVLIEKWQYKPSFAEDLFYCMTIL